MNIKKNLTLTLVLSLLSINNVYAVCTEESKEEFNKIKNQYKITTTFNSETKTYNMKIEEADTDKYDYVFTIRQQYECKKISNTITECTGLKPGTSFYANVIGKTNQCNDVLKEELIKLKRYNEFYGDPLCEGIEEFVLCQELYDREIDRETFESRINAYKKNKQEKVTDEKIEEKKENKSILRDIISYVQENKIQTLIIIVFIVLVIVSMIIMINSSKKSRRLE